MFFSALTQEDTQLHKLQHKHFIEQLSTIRKKNRQSSQLTQELLFFLTGWLINHIQGEDRKDVAKIKLITPRIHLLQFLNTLMSNLSAQALLRLLT